MTSKPSKRTIREEMLSAGYLDNEDFRKYLEEILTDARLLLRSAKHGELSVQARHLIRLLDFFGTLCYKWLRSPLIVKDDKDYIRHLYPEIQGLYVSLVEEMNKEKVPLPAPTPIRTRNDGVALLYENMGKKTDLVLAEDSTGVNHPYHRSAIATLMEDYGHKDEMLDIENPLPTPRGVSTSNSRVAAIYQKLGKKVKYIHHQE